jgi:hypothetical protein
LCSNAISQTSLQLSLSEGVRTSPNKRRSLKLRLLIFSCGELGKQHMQSVKLYRRSKKYCAMVYNAMARLGFDGARWRPARRCAQDLVQNRQDRHRGYMSWRCREARMYMQKGDGGSRSVNGWRSGVFYLLSPPPPPFSCYIASQDIPRSLSFFSSTLLAVLCTALVQSVFSFVSPSFFFSA